MNTFEEAIIVCLTFYVFGVATGYSLGFINGRRYEDRLRFMKRARATMRFAKRVIGD